MTSARRSKVDKRLKHELVLKAGNKCANPGCANWRTHIHHIKHWAVYKAHDGAHMIAVCPSCHDAIHHGKLSITDSTVYDWRNLSRSSEQKLSAGIYIEPSNNLKMVVGGISFATTKTSASLFRFPSGSFLDIRIIDTDILRFSTKFYDAFNHEIFRVSENQIKVIETTHVSFEFRAGHARITLPKTDTLLPPWLLAQIDPSSFLLSTSKQRIIAIDIQVIDVGVVKVQGYWLNGDTALVISDNLLSFHEKGRASALSFASKSPSDTVLVAAGPTDAPMFGFESDSTAPNQSLPSGPIAPGVWDLFRKNR